MRRKPTHRLKLMAALVGACLVAVPARAELYIIAHATLPLDSGDVKSVFTGEKQFSGPFKLQPVDNAAAQEVFLSHAMRMDAARYNTIWTKKSFREGLIPPPVKAGDAEVLEFVRKTPGAVGYVGGGPPRGVLVVDTYR